MFLITFIRIYGVVLFHISPLIIFMILLLVLLGLLVARMEGWSRTLGIYCAFITATTVGYGVVHPTKPRTRVICVVIAFLGLIFTGILVALAFQALTAAATHTGLVERIVSRLSDVQ